MTNNCILLILYAIKQIGPRAANGCKILFIRFIERNIQTSFMKYEMLVLLIKKYVDVMVKYLS